MREAPRELSADEVDDELNLVQSAYIQPVVRYDCQATYTTALTDQVEAVSISDLYALKSVADESTHEPGEPIQILAADDLQNEGVRVLGGTIHIQRLGAGRKLRFVYHRRLRRLGVGTGEVQTPEIPEHWHDLYWLGAVATLGSMQRQSQFASRLEEFRRERLRGNVVGARQARTVIPWE